MSGTAGQYRVNPRASRFNVKAFASGMLKAFAHSPTFAVRDYGVEASFDPTAAEPASLVLTVKAGSLSLLDDVSDSDRKEIEDTMRRDVLDVEHHPEIVFRCSDATPTRTGDGQFEVTLQGELSLRGRAEPQSVSTRLAVSGDALRAWGDFTFQPSDFGIEPVKAAGGMIKMKDEIKGTFDITLSR